MKTQKKMIILFILHQLRFLEHPRQKWKNKFRLIPHNRNERTTYKESIANPFLLITSQVDSIFEFSITVPITDITISCTNRIPQADSIETIKSHKLPFLQMKTLEHTTSFNKDFKIFLKRKIFEHSTYIPSHYKFSACKYNVSVE